MAVLNGKPLCFVDLCGRFGENGFDLGSVMVRSLERGKVDKAFADLFSASVN